VSGSSGRLAFAGRHAVVTGGSSGIGLATARRLAAGGADVTLIARRRWRLDEAKAEVEANRARPEQRVLTISADVSRRDEVAEAIASATAALGAPSLLVTSAGVARPGYLHEVDLDEFERVMAVNYFGTLYAVRAAVPRMAEGGRIVLISSAAGLIGILGYAAYAPTKYAVRGLAETLRGELRPLGIGVSVVYPPDTDTPQLHEENLTKPPETRRITGAARPWTADAVAEQIVRGVERGAFVISPGPEATVLARFGSMLAPALNRYFDFLAARSRRDGVRSVPADEPALAAPAAGAAREG
jgi:3-dehydrosphinganine reductase